MKSLKPIHWILIAILLVEIIAIGVILIIGSKNTPTDIKIPLTYAQNKDGSYSLLSLTESVEAPIIKFTYDDEEYTYDKTMVEILNAYQSFSSFKDAYTNATEDMWKSFKEQVNYATAKNTHKQHPLIQQLRDMAQTSYHVQHAQIYNNAGMYTISATTTIDAWETAFGKYRIKNDKQPTNDMALGASVQIGDTVYHALVYTIVNDDGDAKNNKTAQEVSVFVLFGSDMINDIPLSDAVVSFLTPDTGAPVAHANLKVTYLATTNERCYRDLRKLGGM